MSFIATEDAYVSGASRSTNYGSAPALLVDRDSSGALQVAYLKFRVSGLSSRVRSATLRLCASDGSGQSGGRVHTASNAWSESTLTWDNRPAPGRRVFAQAGPVAAGACVSFDVTRAVNGNGTYSFAVDSLYADGVGYYSRESAGTEPVLVLTGRFSAVAAPSAAVESGPTAAPAPAPTPTPSRAGHPWGFLAFLLEKLAL